MSKKIYCSIANHFLAQKISEDKLNYNTLVKLLEYFDEIHIYGRTKQKKDYVLQDENHQIYMHYISVPNNKIIRYFVTIFKIFFTILKDNKKYNFSLFDASEPTTGGLIGTLLNLITKKPFLLQIQGEMTRIDPKTDGYIRSFVSKYSTIICSKFATKVRVVSNEINKQLFEDGIQDKKIITLPPRVNLDQFNYEKLQYLKIPNDKKQFIFVGRLVVFKGLRYLIEACQYLDKNKYHLTIVGDGELKDDLVQLRDSLNLQENITFVGKVDFLEVPKYVIKSDYFILPSLDEGFGRVILEAMALKTLVIASCVGGIKDIIKGGETGYFIEPANPKNIAKTMKMVLDLDINKQNEIIETSYNIVKNNYEFNSSMNQFINLYKSLLNENS